MLHSLLSSRPLRKAASSRAKDSIAKRAGVLKQLMHEFNKFHHLSTLAELFPNLSKDDLCSIYEDMNGDIDMAIERIYSGHLSQWQDGGKTVTDSCTKLPDKWSKSRERKQKPVKQLTHKMSGQNLKRKELQHKIEEEIKTDMCVAEITSSAEIVKDVDGEMKSSFVGFAVPENNEIVTIRMPIRESTNFIHLDSPVVVIPQMKPLKILTVETDPVHFPLKMLQPHETIFNHSNMPSGRQIELDDLFPDSVRSIYSPRKITQYRF